MSQPDPINPYESPRIMADEPDSPQSTSQKTAREMFFELIVFCSLMAWTGFSPLVAMLLIQFWHSWTNPGNTNQSMTGWHHFIITFLMILVGVVPPFLYLQKRQKSRTRKTTGEE